MRLSGRHTALIGFGATVDYLEHRMYLPAPALGAPGPLNPLIFRPSGRDILSDHPQVLIIDARGGTVRFMRPALTLTALGACWWGSQAPWRLPPLPQHHKESVERATRP